MQLSETWCDFYLGNARIAGVLMRVPPVNGDKIVFGQQDQLYEITERAWANREESPGQRHWIAVYKVKKDRTI